MREVLEASRKRRVFVTFCFNSQTMAAEFGGCSLVSCQEAYAKSLNSFIASLDSKKGNLTLKCLEGHVVPLLSDLFKVHTAEKLPFCVLSVGSGEGGNDLSFIEMLIKSLQGAGIRPWIFQHAIEPDEAKLGFFRAKAEDLRVRLKNRVLGNVDFEWFPMTYDEYIEQTKSKVVKFNVVHFLHSIYYIGADLETALKHCCEKELGPKGVIFSITPDFNSPYARYGKAFSSEGLILSPGSYYSNKEVIDIAKRNGWKYKECSGESVSCNIAGIFDRSSVEGNLLLDFLTQWKNISQTAGEENLKKILSFWENECTASSHGQKLVTFENRTVMIFKES